MALTPTEEAQVRQLLAEQSELLTLAANEPTIMSKLGATKVTLSDLTAATSLADGNLFLVRQSGTDKKVDRSVVAADMKRTGLSGNLILNTTPAPNAAFSINRAFASFVAPFNGKVLAIQSINIGGAGTHPSGVNNLVNITGSASGTANPSDSVVGPSSVHAMLSVVAGETVNVTGVVSGTSTVVTWAVFTIHTSYIFIPTA